MNTNDYFLSMRKRLSQNYDVYESYALNDFQTDLYAHFYARNERYFATKSATVYAYENNEHTFFKRYDTLEMSNISEFVTTLKDSIDDLVTPNDDHMSTILNAVFVTENSVPKSIQDGIRSFKYHKNFFFGLKGWVDVCIIVVSLSDNAVYTSKKAKRAAQHFSPVPLQ